MRPAVTPGSAARRLLVVLSALLAVVSGTATGAVRVAVLPADAAEASARLAERIQIALFDVPDLEQVERLELDRVLQEQALTLADAVAPRHRVQVGRLCGADGMVLVHHDREGTRMHVRVVECVRGYRALHIVRRAETPPPEATVAELVQAIEGAIPKLRPEAHDDLVGISLLSVADRTYGGSEGRLIHEDVPLAIAVAMMQDPRVLFMERESMLALMQEDMLSGGGAGAARTAHVILTGDVALQAGVPQAPGAARAVVLDLRVQAGPGDLRTAWSTNTTVGVLVPAAGALARRIAGELSGYAGLPPLTAQQEADAFRQDALLPQEIAGAAALVLNPEDTRNARARMKAIMAPTWAIWRVKPEEEEDLLARLEEAATLSLAGSIHLVRAIAIDTENTRSLDTAWAHTDPNIMARLSLLRERLRLGCEVMYGPPDWRDPATYGARLSQFCATRRDFAWVLDETVREILAAQEQDAAKRNYILGNFLRTALVVPGPRGDWPGKPDVASLQRTAERLIGAESSLARYMGHWFAYEHLSREHAETHRARALAALPAVLVELTHPAMTRGVWMRSEKRAYLHVAALRIHTVVRTAEDHAWASQQITEAFHAMIANGQLEAFLAMRAYSVLHLLSETQRTGVITAYKAAYPQWKATHGDPESTRAGSNLPRTDRDRPDELWGDARALIKAIGPMPEDPPAPLVHDVRVRTVDLGRLEPRLLIASTNRTWRILTYEEPAARQVRALRIWPETGDRVHVLLDGALRGRPVVAWASIKRSTGGIDGFHAEPHPGWDGRGGAEESNRNLNATRTTQLGRHGKNILFGVQGQGALRWALPAADAGAAPPPVHLWNRSSGLPNAFCLAVVPVGEEVFVLLPRGLFRIDRDGQVLRVDDPPPPRRPGNMDYRHYLDMDRTATAGRLWVQIEAAGKELWYYDIEPGTWTYLWRSSPRGAKSEWHSRPASVPFAGPGCAQMVGDAEHRRRARPFIAATPDAEPAAARGMGPDIHVTPRRGWWQDDVVVDGARVFELVRKQQPGLSTEHPPRGWDWCLFEYTLPQMDTQPSPAPAAATP